MGNQDVSREVEIWIYFPVISEFIAFIVSLYIFYLFITFIKKLYIHASLDLFGKKKLRSFCGAPSLNLHQLHDQSGFPLGMRGPPSGGLCLSPRAILLLKVLEISL